MKKLLRLLLVPLLLVAFMAPKAHADVNDFVINDFTAEYYLDNQDKQGTLRITEQIELTFSDFNHGILRALPASYKKHSLQLKINSIKYGSGAAIPYTTYKENGNIVLKIGDAGKTLTGKQVYQLDYTLSNVVSFYEDHDELYWDINGDQWQQPFEHVSVRLHVPKQAGISNNTLCFTGAFGSEEASCQVNNSPAENEDIVEVQTNRKLNAYETLTVATAFDKGYFRPSEWYETLGEHAKNFLKVAILPMTIGGWAFSRWYRRGRDPRGRGTIVPEYEPPDGLKPIEAGTIMDFRTDNKDVTATIIDLAIHGYVKIIEEKKDRLIRKDKLTYYLEATGKDLSKLADFESQVLDGIFGSAGYSKGKRVSLDSLKSKFYATVKTVKKQATDSVTTKGYFSKTPLRAGAGLITLGSLLFFLTFFVAVWLGLFLTIGLVMSGILCLLFGFLMPSRTVEGVAVKEKMLGLKLYIETAEKDRLALMQAPNAKYATQANLPEKTVELFEKLLPYAMVLGVEKQWAKEFKDIYETPPDWYSGNWHTFNTIVLVDALNGPMATAANMAFAAPSSSGSSGFGGGGFSGGGGGGGGGGGW